MAELAGLIILIIAAATAGGLYLLVRWAREWLAARKRWRVEIRGDGHLCRVQVEQGGMRRVTVATLEATKDGFDTALEEAITKADLLAAQMNANRSIP